MNFQRWITSFCRRRWSVWFDNPSPDSGNSNDMGVWHHNYLSSFHSTPQVTSHHPTPNHQSPLIISLNTTGHLSSSHSKPPVTSHHFTQHHRSPLIIPLQTTSHLSSSHSTPPDTTQIL
ncbi:hypothetical protein Pcinc_034778 [Petrolisthes cinctipes]|uniref:Uncharacterized protein n=1 Tax=Petrolisthes cinctipes TaxID=88211 RepID=A0AAE1BY26_PETCI|nr:hypothetical protein Pcinc_034778 [Petrolisthes cinctipes]